jgi:hypothetical protein
MVMDKSNGKDTEAPVIPESKLIITFAAPGSAMINIDYVNVSPLQVAAAAWILEKNAESGFYQQQIAEQQRAERQKIAVPDLAVRKPIIKP